MRPKSTRVKKTPEELAERKRQRAAEHRREMRYCEEELNKNRVTLKRLLEGRYYEIQRLFDDIDNKLQRVIDKQWHPQIETLNRNFNDVNSNVNLMIGMLQKINEKLK